MEKYVKFLAVCATLLLVTVQAQAYPGQGKSNEKPQAPARVSYEGSVVETMDSGGYTYVCLKNNGQKQWAAIPDSEVKVGQEVEIAAGAIMTNFTSKTLGRTFDTIIFSQGIVNR